MRRIVLSAFMLALFLALLSTRTEAQEFIPYIPDSSQVGLVYWEQAHVSYMNITVEFPDTGFNISSWGTPHITSNNISVDAEIWRWTGMSFPVITTVSYTYTLGDLLSGEYKFFFEVWGAYIRNTTFVVSPEITVPDDYLTIQEAINAAEEGNTIFVRNGTYDEYLNVTKSLVILGENAHNTTVTGFEIYADNVTVSGFTMEAWSYSGVSLYNSCHCNISNNVVFSDFYAIALINSSGNHLADNRIPYSVWGVGIFLMIGCNDNTIRQNSISQQEVGIHILDSHNNTLDCNELFSNYFAIYAYGGFNRIYHNNVVNNNGGIVDAGGNTWDNGCEGNYWSNYNGADSDGDGIGDTYLPWEGVDSYPLMNLYWNLGDIDHDLDVDIFDLVRCAGAYGSTPSSPNWNPHCDIAEPFGIINIFDLVTIAASYGEEYTP